MEFKPHILQVSISALSSEDEFGRPVYGEPQWETLCGCRADNQTGNLIKDTNGAVLKHEWHVVCEPPLEVQSGQTVRILSQNKVLCEGQVKRTHTLNYLPYAEFWI